jgi:hypothetical protein
MDSENVMPLSEDNIKNSDYFAGFDFENVWIMDDYPVFRYNTDIKEPPIDADYDVNGDGKVNAADAALIYAYANGKISSFPGR